MSRSPPGSSVEDKTFFLEYRCHPELRVPPLPTSPPGKPGSITAPDTASFSAASSPTACEPRRIVLSTESPAALKVGTQQLIPKSLAVSTKTKNPSRHQSFGAAGLSKEPLCPDPKRASAPSISLEAEVEDDYGGALKRNLRNMSYRAAMRGLGAEPEPVNAATSLRPVPEEGSALPARSPGRNKVGCEGIALVRGTSPALPGDEPLPGICRAFFFCNFRCGGRQRGPQEGQCGGEAGLRRCPGLTVLASACVTGPEVRSAFPEAAHAACVVAALVVSVLVPCAAIMSRSPPGSSVEDKTFFLEYRCHPELRVPPLPTSPPGKPGSITAPDTASFSAASSPTACEPRRIVLSTESPAALKVGTQQLIPKSLAVSTKTKNPSRHQSFGAAGLSKEPLCPDPKRASAPSISLEAEVEDDYGGALKRNLRNMSYRAAMRGLGAEPEPVNAATSLRPVPEEGSALPARSPGRNKAMFEIITSEYSYGHSLNVLVHHFMASEELKDTMTQMEHHHLFSNISDILAVSTSFFKDLEKRHQENLLMPDISDIVEEHASNHFNPYVSYCSNEVYQQRTLQKLLATNPTFKEALKQIERKPECGGLPMISFLILPMQRVTRLPLLLDTLCQKTKACTAAYGAATRALKAISKLVKNCNEGARAMERTEQMYTLQKQLEFGKMKPFPLISASRWLLKRGELYQLLSEEAGIFRKGSGRVCYLFLFNDVLIITKKKSEESYTVMNYATLDQITVEKIENMDPPSPPPGKAGTSGTARSAASGHLFRVLMEKNSESRREEIVLSAETLSDRARWIAALMHREKEKPDTVPKGDLSQVEITRAYLARQTDEISLQQADVVLVLGGEDGWLWGERLRDGERGWFPQSCARQITNRMAVECNVRRMERLRIETDV
nr:PREDICTED: rho guanine nucleotide exchange factor 16 [Apteryx mantelli mantelli]